MPEPQYWKSELLAWAGVTARFYGRRGGSSRGDLASLNLGANEGDDPNHLAANERLILDDLLAESLYLPTQVHGTVVHLITDRYDGVVRGPEGDASWANVSGSAVGVLTADCVPILLSTRQGDLVGAVHAGWRGLYQGIIAEALRTIRKAYRREPDEFFAAIGPSIDTDHYEVDRELAQRFSRERPELDGVVWSDQRQKPHLDLRLMAKNDLLVQGLPEEAIEIVGPSTFDDACFSHRRDHGKTGRQLASILIP